MILLMTLKPVIIFGGLPSVGSSTLAKRMASSLDLEYVYVGKIFREMCIKDGHCDQNKINTPEFEDQLSYYVNNILKNDTEVDIKVDAQILKQIIDTDKPLLVEGRTISALVTKQNINVVLKIWVKADLKSRINRFKDKFPNVKWNEEHIKQTLLTRDKADAQRYQKLYGINLFKPENYNDIIFDTTGINVDQSYMALTTNPIFKEKIKKLFDFYPTYDVVYRWKCLVCGYTYEGFKPIKICPNCGNIDPSKFQDLD